VPADLQRANGAVSAEGALAMARGVRDRLDTDIAIGVTGIAGPAGGSEEKPVGTVYFALIAREGTAITLRENWQGDRESYKEQTAARAIRLVQEFIDRPADK
jgi:nicotinamide-nucleotide amidase